MRMMVDPVPPYLHATMVNGGLTHRAKTADSPACLTATALLHTPTLRKFLKRIQYLIERLSVGTRLA
jgi:hypothetical protein